MMHRHNARRITCCLCDGSMSTHDACLLLDSEAIAWLDEHCTQWKLPHPYHAIHKYHSLSEDSYQRYLAGFPRV